LPFYPLFVGFIGPTIVKQSTKDDKIKNEGCGSGSKAWTWIAPKTSHNPLQVGVIRGVPRICKELMGNLGYFRNAGLISQGNPLDDTWRRTSFNAISQINTAGLVRKPGTIEGPRDMAKT
jgi:hypothetical protein